jgi:hypothetical protein
MATSDIRLPLRVVSQEYSLPGTTDDLIIPGLQDFSLATRMAARLSGPTCRAWVEDAKGTRLFEAGPLALSA